MKGMVAKSLVLLSLACLGVEVAHACWLCDSSGGYPYCAQAGLGGEIRVSSSTSPYCQVYFNDCSTGCIVCPPGCCASLREGSKGACSTVKKMAWQESAAGPEVDKANHFQEFLAMADRGVFDGKIVYTHPDSGIAKGIMNLPIHHWKSFTEKVVMKGGQKDPRLDPKLQSQDRPQTILEIETKTGHKLVIHLVEESATEKGKSQPQSKSRNPAIEDRL